MGGNMFYKGVLFLVSIVMYFKENVDIFICLFLKEILEGFYKESYIFCYFLLLVIFFFLLYVNGLFVVLLNRR